MARPDLKYKAEVGEISTSKYEKSEDTVQTNSKAWGRLFLEGGVMLWL